MTNRPRNDESRNLSFFSKHKDSDDEHPPISGETYDRIPDQFKRPADDEKSEDRDNAAKRNTPDNNNNDENRKFERNNPRLRGDDRQPPRGFRVSGFVFVLALAGLCYFAYQSFFGVKTTEITWQAFNRLLDSNQVASAQLKGTRLNGRLREVPELKYWPEILPEGKEQFEGLIKQFDRTYPDKAKELNDALEAELADEKLTIAEKKTTDAAGKPTLALQLTLDDGTIFKTIELPSDAGEQDRSAAQTALVESYKLGKKIEQRWKLTPADGSRPGMQGSFAMVEAHNGKATRKIFTKKYVCETPAFAYADSTIDAKLRQRLESYSSEQPSDSSSWVMLLSVAVSVLFLVLLFRMFRNASDQIMGGGMGGLGAMRSLAKRYEPNGGQRYTFDDVAGMDQVKQELVEIVDYLKNPAKYERMGARVPKGTLLFGPPGTGKTLLARAVAGEANVPFYSINGSEFIQMFVGVGASRVRELFATAKENAPAILFIDEIDAVGRQRGAGVGGGQDEREQTLNQILSEMDGFTQNDSVMVMASTNRPDVLDPALMRPGRFDRHITVGRPSMKGRVDIFKVYLKKIPYAADVDVDALAKLTSGFTGADIRNFVNEATLWATRNNKDVVEASDFSFAFEKIALGLKREEIVSPENKRKTAYHEAGHTLIGWFLPNGSRVHKVSIIPRGRALGVTWSLPDEDQLNYNESEARATLSQLLAGRAAELLVYNETSSGVENDLQRATELARNMITRWGMSETLGAVAYPDTETHPFLGREMSTGVRSYSEDAAKMIDIEIRKTIDEADAVAKNLIVEKRELFEKLTNALVEEEELDVDRIREILGPSPNDKDEAEDKNAVTIDKADDKADNNADNADVANAENAENADSPLPSEIELGKSDGETGRE